MTWPSGKLSLTVKKLTKTFFQKNCQKLPLAILLKIPIFGIFLKKMSSFWQFFDSQWQFSGGSGSNLGPLALHVSDVQCDYQAVALSHTTDCLYQVIRGMGSFPAVIIYSFKRDTCQPTVMWELVDRLLTDVMWDCWCWTLNKNVTETIHLLLFCMYFYLNFILKYNINNCYIYWEFSIIKSGPSC